MNTVSHLTTAVNPYEDPPIDWGDIIPFNGEVHPDEVLANLLTASRQPWQIATLDRIVTAAKETGDRVERVMAPRVGWQKAQRAATRTYNHYIQICFDKRDWALWTVPAYELEMSDTFWRESNDD